MVKGLAIILALLFAGQALVEFTGLPLPGSVVGMALMALCLSLGWIDPESVRAPAHALVNSMSLLFVPAGVGLMLYWDLLAENWLPLAVAFVVSSAAVLAVVGLLQQSLERRARRRGRTAGGGGRA